MCPASLCFNQLSTGAAARFFITGEQQDHWTMNTQTHDSAGMHGFEGEGAISFHIKNARPIDAISFDTAGRKLQGPAWMNCVRVPNDNDRLGARIAKGSQAQVLAVVL